MQLIMRALVVVLALDATNQADAGHGDEKLNDFQLKTAKKGLNSISHTLFLNLCQLNSNQRKKIVFSCQSDSSD